MNETEYHFLLQKGNKVKPNYNSVDLAEVELQADEPEVSCALYFFEGKMRIESCFSEIVTV